MTMASTAPTPALVPTLLTATEFATKYENIHAELVKGIVKEYPVPSQLHGKICMTIAGLIWYHVKTAGIGHVTTNDSWVQTNRDPDTLRGADVCYFSYERLPKGPVPDGLLQAVPDLVVEVRSPSDRWNEVFGKVSEYLGAGVRAVLILDPDTRTAAVYRIDELQVIYDNGDELTVPEILPGFAVKVSSLFA